MKILILANDSAGLFNFRNELLQTLLSEHKVYVCLPDGKYIPDLKKMGCKYIRCDFNRHGLNPLGELKILNNYFKVIKRIRPDCVLTYTIKPNIYGGIACSFKKIPYIENITGLGTAAAGKGIVSSITLLLYKIGLRKAQRVFFQNKENFDLFVNKKIVKKRQSKLIPGSGVNLSKFVPLEYPDKDSTEFTYVGRMMHEKGIDLYLKAAETIHDKYPDTIFHICGQPEKEWEPNMSKVETLEKKGAVIYHGRVDDMPSIYRIVNCVIHPSFYPEGMSNVLLEASASARPVIANNLPGRGEIVDDNVNGLIVKPNDASDLIEKIELFLRFSNEKRRQMGLMGRKKVEKEFDRNIVINQYMKEIRRVRKNGL